jgi:tripartite-type tricarboxylate transporter receptor subunit TctC
MARRWGLRASLGLLALAFSAGIASAQDAAASYPNKPIRMVVGFAAGGGNDIFARLIASELQKRTGWTVVIENKPGAGGRVSAEHVAREPADGYTLLVGASGAMVIGPLIYKTEYNTLKSFTPVTMIGDFPLFIRPRLPRSLWPGPRRIRRRRITRRRRPPSRCRPSCSR